MALRVWYISDTNTVSSVRCDSRDVSALSERLKGASGEVLSVDVSLEDGLLTRSTAMYKSEPHVLIYSLVSELATDRIVFNPEVDGGNLKLNNNVSVDEALAGRVFEPSSGHYFMTSSTVNPESFKLLCDIVNVVKNTLGNIDVSNEAVRKDVVRLIKNDAASLVSAYFASACTCYGAYAAQSSDAKWKASVIAYLNLNFVPLLKNEFKAPPSPSSDGGDSAASNEDNRRLFNSIVNIDASFTESEKATLAKIKTICKTNKDKRDFLQFVGNTYKFLDTTKKTNFLEFAAAFTNTFLHNKRQTSTVPSDQDNKTGTDAP